MSGAGEASLVLGIISSIISIIDATHKFYTAVEDEKGLPKNFKKSAASLPLIIQLLEDAQDYISSMDDETTKAAFVSTLQDCELRAKKLQDLFSKVMPDDKSSRLDRYLKAARTIGKGGRVESLMKGILDDMQLMATKFPDGINKRKRVALDEAIEDVSKMEPSLPDGFEEASAFTHYGSGAQNNNTGSGIQHINSGSGHQNSGAGIQYIGTNHIETHTITKPPKNTKPYYKIPHQRNSCFVNRKEIFEKLEMRLSSKHPNAALWGLGGSGKTQIALEYAYQQFEKRICSIFWVHADSYESLLKDYREIAYLFKPKHQFTGRRLMDFVRASIERQPNWLLIIDNAEPSGHTTPRLTTAKPRRLLEFIPQAPNGRTLWITRDGQIAEELVDPKGTIHVEEMQTPEAKELLASLITSNDITKEDPIAVEALLDWLDRLPLAIFQAGVYMKITSTSVPEYVQKLEKAEKRWKLLGKSHPDSYRQFGATNSVLYTWQVSVDSLLKDSPCAYKILHTIAYFNDRNILLDLIKAAARSEDYNSEGVVSVRCGKIRGKDDDHNDDDEEDILAAVVRLEQFSFLRKQKSGKPGYHLQRLVREATLYSIARNRDNNGGLHFSKTALEILSYTFPISNQHNWGKCEDLLPHAVTISSSIEVRQEISSISTLLVKIWSYLNDAGRARENTPIKSKILELNRKFLGEYPGSTVLTTAKNMLSMFRLVPHLEALGNQDNMPLYILGYSPDTSTPGARLYGGEHAAYLYTAIERGISEISNWCSDQYANQTNSLIASKEIRVRIAAHKGLFETLETLNMGGADLLSIKEESNSMLTNAIARNGDDLINCLLSQLNIGINQGKHAGRTSLILAQIKRNDNFTALLNKDLDPNAPDSEENTFQIHISLYDYPGIVQWLLKYSADLVPTAHTAITEIE